MKRKLILEDGTVMIGKSFGDEKETIGEVVFTGGATGYQEAISDPSNYGQILTFSYPLVGNTGINRDDFESIHPVIKGVVAKEVCEHPSNWRSSMTLGEYLKLKRIPGISGIDTRMLTKLIGEKGSMKGAICHEEEDEAQVIARLKATTFPKDEVKRVTATKAYPSPGRGKNVIVIDFGVKHAVLRELTNRGCDVIVVPCSTPAAEILALKPDGVLLSNGPGDPENVSGALEMIREVQEEIPLLGIGLGHQLFAMANDAEVEKMHAGHRGLSYPVKDMESGKVIFTAQNHGYAVARQSIDPGLLKTTYVDLNSGTVEGLEHVSYPAFSVQFEPEASAGSEDGKVIFGKFIEKMEQHRKVEKQHA